MHEVIQHVGIVAWLDCLQLHAARNISSIQTSDDFAGSEPNWTQLQEMVNLLSLEQVATSDSDSAFLHSHLENTCNIQQENMLMQQQDFLLYEEVSYLLNIGDIRWVETCFMP